MYECIQNLLYILHCVCACACVRENFGFIIIGCLAPESLNASVWCSYFENQRIHYPAIASFTAAVPLQHRPYSSGSSLNRSTLSLRRRREVKITFLNRKSAAPKETELLYIGLKLVITNGFIISTTFTERKLGGVGLG